MPDASGKVVIGLGVTYNLGNYESLRVDISLDAVFPGEMGSTQDEVVKNLSEKVRSVLYPQMKDEIATYRELRPDLE